MTNASRDNNRVTTLLGVSSLDLNTPTRIASNPVTGALLIDSTSLYTGLDPRYVNVTGDTMTGALVINNAADMLQLPAMTNGSILFTGGGGYVRQDNSKLSFNDTTDDLYAYTMSTSALTVTGWTEGWVLHAGAGGLMTGENEFNYVTATNTLNVANVTSTGTVNGATLSTANLSLNTNVITSTTGLVHFNDDNLYTTGYMQANYFASDVAIGTSPFQCTSTTLNTNLNADLLDGQHGTYYQQAGLCVLKAGDTMTGALGINVNSTTALLVEQDGVKDNVLVVDTTNGVVGVTQLQLANIGATQPILFTQRGGTNLSLQGQTSATAMLLEMFAKDGDGTDNVTAQFWAKGTPLDITNRERLISGYVTTVPDFRIYTEAAGTGTVRPLKLFTGTNTSQLYLETDGKVGIAKAPTLAALDIAGGVFSTSQNKIDGTSDQIQLIVQGHSTQTANLQEWQNSSGTVLTSVNPEGRITIATGILSNPTAEASTLLATSTISTTSDLTNNYYGLKLELSSGATAYTPGYLYGVQGFVFHNGTGTALAEAYGSFAGVRTNSTGTINAAVDYAARGGTRSGKTGNITALTHFYASPSIAGTGTVGTHYGLRVGNMGNTYVTTPYGIYIDSQSGSTTNYAIYTNAGIIHAGDKIEFTQTDGNEYIDSGSDGWVNIGATTGVEINAPILNVASIYSTNGFDCGDAGGFSGTKYNATDTRLEFYIDGALKGYIGADGAYVDAV